MRKLISSEVRTSSVGPHRANAVDLVDWLEIESGAERQLAVECAAAQARGEVATAREAITGILIGNARPLPPSWA